MRRGMRSIAVYFGLREDEHGELAEHPHAERILFAFAIPLWAVDRVGSWLWLYAVLAGIAGVVAVAQWRASWEPPSWLRGGSEFLQAVALCSLGLLFFAGNDFGAVRALAWTAGVIGALRLLVRTMEAIGRRRESRSAASR